MILSAISHDLFGYIHRHVAQHLVIWWATYMSMSQATFNQDMFPSISSFFVLTARVK